MRRRGTPRPRMAASTPIEPGGIALMALNSFAPRRMIEPLPNWRSIWVSAVSAALSLSDGMMAILPAPLKVRFQEQAERSEEHTSELQSRLHLVCRLLLEK